MNESKKVIQADMDLCILAGNMGPETDKKLAAAMLETLLEKGYGGKRICDVPIQEWKKLRDESIPISET